MGVVDIGFEFRNQRFTDASKGLEAYLKSLNESWDGSAKVLEQQLKTYLDSVGEALRQRHSGAYPSTGPKNLSLRSGDLVASILGSVKVTGTTFRDLAGQIGSNLPYASTQEYGATIVAKGKYLTIPLPPALNANGTPIKKRAKDWANTFIAKSKKGNLIIFQKRGTEIVPLYVLREQVIVPPRLGMGATIRAGLPYFVDTTLDRMVQAILASK